MRSKLAELNGFVKHIVEEVLPPDALLVVVGDHGMTASGNHGGSSDSETGAALFMYSSPSSSVALERPRAAAALDLPLPGQTRGRWWR